MQPPKNSRYDVLPEGAERCVWMTAGIVTWKLCDREFDCDRCPLDAALRGRPLPATASAGPPRRRSPWVFPEDRRYARDHTWVQTVESGHLRVGLDALAGELLSDVRAVGLPQPGERLAAGEVAAVLETVGGDMEVRMPVGARILVGNPALESDPSALIGAPYEDGWLVEAVPADDDGAAAAPLLTGAEIRRQAHLDVQRFQRMIAMELLAGQSAVGPTMADGGEPVVELRQLLGSERYLRLVRELLR